MANEKVLSEEPEKVEKAEVEVIDNIDDVSLIITLNKPYTFERETYTELNREGLNDLTANDMIAVDKRLKRGAVGIDVMPEVSLEYAINIAARASKLPIEFFEGLPPKEAIKVKNRVMGFFFGSE